MEDFVLRSAGQGKALIEPKLADCEGLLEHGIVRGSSPKVETAAGAGQRDVWRIRTLLACEAAGFHRCDDLFG